MSLQRIKLTFIYLGLFLLLLTVSGCFILRWFGIDDAVEEVNEMTDEEIEALVASYEATVIGQNPILLESQTGGIFRISLPLQERSGISIQYLNGPNCAEYCWTQVMRESLDGVVVKEHTKIPGGANPASTWEAEREEQERKQTDEGYVVDGECNPAFKGNSYKDDPIFPHYDFENNEINSKAKLFVAEFEVCVKCTNPATDYFACIEWLYVRIKNGGASKTYVVTKNAVNPGPSQKFTEAVQKWNQ